MTTRLRVVCLSALICLLLFAGGCDRATDEPMGNTERFGLHGGHHLVMSREVGFRFEFTLDSSRELMVLYVEDSTNGQPYPLPAKTLDASFRAGGRHFDLPFSSDPRPNDPDAFCSRFVTSLESVPQQLLSFDVFELEVKYAASEWTVVGTYTHSNDHSHAYHHD